MREVRHPARRRGGARSARGGRRPAAAPPAADPGAGDDRRLRRRPAGLAVLYPRSHKRDVALFALQMWAFTMVHELPYDDPDRAPRAASRPATRSSPTARSASAGCRTPAFSAALARLPGVGALNRFLTWVHWLWFLEPYAALVYILLRHPERFPRAARRLAAVFDVGCAVYFAVPTAPPWWASEQGLTGEEVRRIMVEVGEETWRSAWPAMYGALGGNPWAAMPSLHFATSAVGGRSRSPKRAGRAGARRLGLRADASASRSSTWASTTSPISPPAPPWSSPSAGRAARRAAVEA